jgi:hypothetical protein
MAISDFFSGGNTPDYLSGLLDDDQLQKLKANAQRNAMLQFGLSALAQGGYSQTPVGIGEILGKSGMAGMQGYQQGIQGGIENIGTRAKLEELQRKKQEDTQRKAYMQQFVSTLPENQRAAVTAMPELGAELAKNQFIPKKPVFEKVGNQLLDVSTGVPTVAFTGATEAPFKVGQTRDYLQGDKRITEEYQADGTFKKIAEGSAFAPASQVNVNMPSESERTAGFLTSRLQNSLNQLQSVTNKNPKAAKPTIGAEAVKTLTGSDYLTNLANPESRQQIEAAQLEILDSALTLGTGAAYTREQLQNYSKSYFPQLGDKPNTIKDKQARLAALLKSAKIKGGRASPEDVGLPANVSVERVR